MNDFKKRLAESKSVPLRVAIPEVDPEAAPIVDAPRAEIGKTGEATQPPVTKTVANADISERPFYLTPVDTSESIIAVGFHMHPSRRQQLKDLEYHTGKKPWQTVEEALEEYMIKHFGQKRNRKAGSPG